MSESRSTSRLANSPSPHVASSVVQLVDHCHRVHALSAWSRDLSDPIVHVIELKAKGPAHRGMHVVCAGDVREFEYLHVAEIGPQSIEYSVGDPDAFENEAVGVRENRSLNGREAIGDRPCA